MPPTEAANAAQIAHWNDQAGPTWVAFNAALDRQISPLGLKAMTALAPRAGERVIDIGCGCGETSLQLAKRVGAGGSVLGADISAPMLALAMRRAAKQGLSQVSFAQGDAQTFAFAPAGADAAFSRFGVMFFADTVAAFSNIRAALKPGGRFAFVCWRPMAENPWMGVPLRAGLEHLPPPPPPNPDAPGPFFLADPARIEGFLAKAGFTAIDIKPHDQPIGSGGLEETVGFALKIGPLGALCRENPDRVGEVETAVRAALAPYDSPDGVRLASATWIVFACNP